MMIEIKHTPAARHGRPAVALALLLALAACAGRPSEPLEQARASVGAIQNDGDVREHAAVQLDQAEGALQRLEAAWEEDEPGEEIEHLAYVTQRRVAVAEARAEEGMAQEEMDRLAEARGQVVLQAREREVATLEQRLAELQAKPTERGLVLTLGDILFEVDGTDLAPGGIQQLTRLADALRTEPERNIVIEGHTDSTGTDAYNNNLSQQRAFSVEDFLISQGLDPRRIVSRGYGEQFPVATNDTMAGRQQNRRVEIVILDEGQTVVPRG